MKRESKLYFKNFFENLEDKINIFVLIIAFLLLLVNNSFSQSIMGMKIEKVWKFNNSLEIITTGAEFLYKDGILECFQRIPIKRKILEIKIPGFLLNKRYGDDEKIYVENDKLILIIHSDSLVILKAKENIDLIFKKHLTPKYYAIKHGKCIFIDSSGGFGIYPINEKKVQFSQNFNNITYKLGKNEEIWFCVFPPRPYNWKRVSQLIAHEGSLVSPYPSNDIIQEDSKYCKIFTLHAYFWKDATKEEKIKFYGKNHWRVKKNLRCPWLASKYVPSDMKEFIRVRDFVHKNGMKFVVYFSPYYSSATNIFNEIKWVIRQYKVDGLYFDGIAHDFREAYYIAKQARKILGDDKILYFHLSSMPLPRASQGGVKIIYPFIDTYADYILRGEAGTSGLPLKEFLRWIVSEYNISNAVGYWCYSGSSGRRGKVPTKEHINLALKNYCFIWRRGKLWSRYSKELKVFDKYYYSKVKNMLKRMQKSHE